MNLFPYLRIELTRYDRLDSWRHEHAGVARSINLKANSLQQIGNELVDGVERVDEITNEPHVQCKHNTNGVVKYRIALVGTSLVLVEFAIITSNFYAYCKE